VTEKAPEPARVRANRRNAKASTGPRTAPGKARVAQNALRHGLNVPIALDQSLGLEIDRLAKLIVGADTDRQNLAAARRIAEAQLDIIRVRRARLALLTDPDARTPLLTLRDLQKVVNALTRGPDPDEASDEMLRLVDTRKLQGPELSLEAGLDLVAPQLGKLDRYERRALSRRKTAFRDYEKRLSLIAAGRLVGKSS
jgi:hypothetical protein